MVCGTANCPILNSYIDLTRFHPVICGSVWYTISQLILSKQACVWLFCTSTVLAIHLCVLVMPCQCNNHQWNFLWVALILLKIKKTNRHEITPSPNCKKFPIASSRWKWYIRLQHVTCCSLLSVCRSPWWCVYASRNDQAMITLTGFDVNSFNYLLGLCANVFDHNSPFADDGGTLSKRYRTVEGQESYLLQIGWACS